MGTAHRAYDKSFAIKLEGRRFQLNAKILIRSKRYNVFAKFLLSDLRSRYFGIKKYKQFR